MRFEFCLGQFAVTPMHLNDGFVTANFEGLGSSVAEHQCGPSISVAENFLRFSGAFVLRNRKELPSDFAKRLLPPAVAI
jgi:hypothetical protein